MIKSSCEGVIYFLFMIYSRINNEEIWADYLKDVPLSNYKVFIHVSSKENFYPPKLFDYSIVPTVQSTYCIKTVPPMNQLLKYALNTSISEFDRFIFLSEQTIPVKSFRKFQDMYLSCDASGILSSFAVTIPPPSDFCIIPTDQWFLYSQLNTMRSMVVKHHQWVNLNR